MKVRYGSRDRLDILLVINSLDIFAESMRHGFVEFVTVMRINAPLFQTPPSVKRLILNF